jgi:hypothetical protein
MGIAEIVAVSVALSMGLAVLFLPQSSLAASTDTLPEGIYSPSLRYGIINGLDQKYKGDGALWGLGDTHAVEFNAPTLSRFNQQAQDFVAALNKIGTSRLGDNINFGTLVPDIKPQVNYVAPVIARGITTKWTLGVGLPVINYRNSISFSVQNSNLDYYKSLASTFSDPSMTAALNTDLVRATLDTIASKGYKPLESRNETYLGDVQLASLYRFWESNNASALYSATFNLPTGPQYDPDDMAALNVFGRSGVENRVTLSYLMGAHWELAPYLSYMAYFPDQVTMRVPLDENDVIPDQNSKENVRRQIGGTAMIGGNVNYTINDQWSLGTGYSYEQKALDSYQGNQGRRYDLLSSGTEDSAHRIYAQINFSTVKSYFRKLSLLPGVITFNYMDTIAGTNVERRTLEELVFMMFF